MPGCAPLPAMPSLPARNSPLQTPRGDDVCLVSTAEAEENKATSPPRFPGGTQGSGEKGPVVWAGLDLATDPGHMEARSGEKGSHKPGVPPRRTLFQARGPVLPAGEGSGHRGDLICGTEAPCVDLDELGLSRAHGARSGGRRERVQPGAHRTMAALCFHEPGSGTGHTGPWSLIWAF